MRLAKVEMMDSLPPRGPFFCLRKNLEFASLWPGHEQAGTAGTVKNSTSASSRAAAVPSTTEVSNSSKQAGIRLSAGQRHPERLCKHCSPSRPWQRSFPLIPVAVSLRSNLAQQPQAGFDELISLADHIDSCDGLATLGGEGKERVRLGASLVSHIVPKAKGSCEQRVVSWIGRSESDLAFVRQLVGPEAAKSRMVARPSRFSQKRGNSQPASQPSFLVLVRSTCKRKRRLA